MRTTTSDDPDDAAALALLRRLGTERMPHRSGRSLFDHLVGLGRIAEAWGLPRRVRGAALFHSVYGTSVYRDAAAGRDRRALVRATIGADAERLAFAFGAIDRPRFSAAVAAMADAPTACTIRARFGDTVDYEAPDVVDLALLGTANEIEQTCADDGSPAPWRPLCGTLLAALTRWMSTPLPDALRAAFAVSERAEAEAIAGYAGALATLRSGDGPAASARFRAVADEAIAVAEPLVWLAVLAARAGDAPTSARAAAEARARFHTWGTAWDKRLSFEAWIDATVALERGIASTALVRLIDEGP